MTTASCVSLLPEIQIAIIDQIEDKKTLLSLMLVNKLCFNHVTNSLWSSPRLKQNKAFSTLSSIESRERRQFYASKFRRLIDMPMQDDAITELFFPALERYLIFDAPLSHPCHNQYLQPALKELSLFYELQIDSDSLETVCIRCPNLSLLYIRGTKGHHDEAAWCKYFSRLHSMPLVNICAFRGVDHVALAGLLHVLGDNDAPNLAILHIFQPHGKLWTHRLVGLLQRCRSLQVLEITLDETDTDPAIQENYYAALTPLAAMGTLRKLKMPSMLDRNAVLKALTASNASAPFAGVRKMELDGSSWAVTPILAPAMSSLTKVDLTVDDTSHTIFRTLGGLLNLSKLSICFTRVSPYPPRDYEQLIDMEDFEALACLKELKELRISHDYSCVHKLSAPSLTDDEFENWLVNFPAIKVLHLGWYRCSLTLASVISLARIHPNLRSCCLGWQHDLSEWKTLPKPLFPNLSQLELGSIVPPYEGVEIANRRDHVPDDEDEDGESWNLDEMEGYEYLLAELMPEISRFGIPYPRNDADEWLTEDFDFKLAHRFFKK